MHVLVSEEEKTEFSSQNFSMDIISLTAVNVVNGKESNYELKLIRLLA